MTTIAPTLYQRVVAADACKKASARRPTTTAPTATRLATAKTRSCSRRCSPMVMGANPTATLKVLHEQARLTASSTETRPSCSGTEAVHEAQAAVAAADSTAMRKLDEQATALKRLKLAPAALDAALAALDREREELPERAAKRTTAPTDRAKRLLTRIPEIVAKYQHLIEQGIKVLASPEAVAEGSEAIRSLLVDGRMTLGPNAAHDRVVGTLQLRDLGDLLLDMAGCARRVGALPLAKKLSGSGGRI